MGYDLNDHEFLKAQKEISIKQMIQKKKMYEKDKATTSLTSTKALNKDSTQELKEKS